MENGPFIDDLPIKNGDFPWLITRWYMFCTRIFLKDPSSRSGADHGSLEVLKPGYTQETKTWLVVLTPLKNHEFVSWDDYSQYMESHKIHVPNHQPETYITVMLKVKSWISNRNEKVVTSSLYTGCLIVVHPRMIVIFHIFS